MQFNLHADYAKAAAPRSARPRGTHGAQPGHEPPPRPVRAYVARALAVVGRARGPRVRPPRARVVVTGSA